MDPSISTQSQQENILRFTLTGVNVSLANAIRRTIIAEIPTIVFRTFPHEQNMATITINTTRMNNELLKQRLSCIPIHITDVAFPIDNYQVEIIKKNDSSEIIYITTEDFRIKDIKTDTYLAVSEQKRIFPPCSITGNYIEFARLRPRLSDDIPGEELSMTCGFSIGIAAENGSFNVASTSTYATTPDLINSNQVLTGKLKELKSMGTPSTELERIKLDWYTLEAKRFTKPDSFDFTLESVGVFSNSSLVLKASHVIISKLRRFQDQIQTEERLITIGENTIPHSFDIILENEDYTLGKILEYILYSTYYGKTLTYCGFNKPHPHKPFSIIRIAFKKPIDKSEIITYLLSAAASGIVAFEKIASEFEE